MNLIRRIRLFTAACAVAVLGLGGVLPAMVSADTAQETVCETLDAKKDCSNPTPNGSISLDTIIKVTVELLSFVVGVIAVIMIIVGGFRYITSGGDSGKVSSAKNTIIYAIIGLAVAALAQIIAWFVLNHLK